MKEEISFTVPPSSDEARRIMRDLKTEIFTLTQSERIAVGASILAGVIVTSEDPVEAYAIIGETIQTYMHRFERREGKALQ